MSNSRIRNSAKQILDLKIYLNLIEIISALLHSVIDATAVVTNYWYIDDRELR